MNAPARVGWCPGALRPMASGDGLILRVKPRGGVLTLAQARRIAEVAQRYGNGALDLTSRANVQIRGVEEGTLSGAIEALDQLGLIDPDPAAEAVRNIVASPLAGIDGTALLDIRPLVKALERRLADDETLHRLPAKFSFVVDDGGALGLGDVTADIRFEAVERDGSTVFAVRLGGEESAEGICGAFALVEAASALGRILIEANATDPEIFRMRHLVRRDGAPATMRRAGLGSLCLCPPWGEAGPKDRMRRVSGQHGVVGFTSQTQGRWGYLRVAVSFGRLDAHQLETIVAVAEHCGALELRLTPWRAILIPGLPGEDALDAAKVCAAAGLIVDAADPRLSVAACPGAPGCHRGSTPVLSDAARLAQALGTASRQTGVALHVSGCGKGCAHAGQAPITLVGHDGRYDIILDGRASDAPAVLGLSIEDVERRIGALSMREGGR